MAFRGSRKLMTRKRQIAHAKQANREARLLRLPQAEVDLRRRLDREATLGFDYSGGPELIKRI